MLAHARRLAGPDAAEDVVQDALLRALRAYPRLRHADHLRAWLFRVTTSAAIDAHRARPREQPFAEPPEAAAEDAYDPGGDFEALIAWAREQPDCTRVLADAACTNLESIRVMEGAGMRRAGSDGRLVYYEL